MSRFHRAVATLLVLTCTLAGSIDGSFVICIEANGHVSFERAGDGCCEARLDRGEHAQERAAARDSNVGGVDPSNGSCASCIDLPLTSGTGPKLASGKLHLPDRAPMPQPAAAPLADFTAPRARRIDSSAIDRPACDDLTQQRTVVIVC
jgi:hypothetical protein